MSKKVEMPCQDPNIRNKNFNEVNLGYTFEMAIEEANRCLNCKTKPCVNGCPANVDIPEFIAKIKENKIEEAYNIISVKQALPGVCGRVCPQENQCEKVCVRGIKSDSVKIGNLERFVSDYMLNNNLINPEKIESNGIKVAIIGSGPSGLACASDLVRLGYDVTIFEALHLLGGVLVYGIPEFRLPKKIVEQEIEILKQLGVKVCTNVVVGKSITIDELFEMGYQSIFIGSGAGLPKFMNIEGESLNGVYSANEYLTRINLMKAYKDDCKTPILNAKNVVVVGGGNVAMDAARSAKRLPSTENVYLVYRRSIDELPARKEEVHHAQEEGIIFKFLNNPVKILGDENNFVSKMEVIKMELSEPDESNRRRPVEIKDSNYLIDCDCVIMAIGTSPNPILKKSSNLEFTKYGQILVDENLETSIKGVFAGGDAVTGAATVILAIEAGKKAAKSINNYLLNK